MAVAIIRRSLKIPSTLVPVVVMIVQDAGSVHCTPRSDVSMVSGVTAHTSHKPWVKMISGSKDNSRSILTLYRERPCLTASRTKSSISRWESPWGIMLEVRCGKF